MINRYQMMKSLRDRLNELFRLCGTEGERIQVAPAPALIRLVEKLIRDQALCSYLEGLDAQAEQAVQSMKERQLDEWNNQQNEERLAQLERELEQERAGLRKAEETLSQERRQGAEREDQYRRERLSAIQDLIALRDKLLLRRNWLEEEAPQEENAHKLAESQLRETARCLSNLGVEILEAGGAFDGSYQTVVETRPAEAPDQADQIAERFRPGYRFQGEILRPQEVILFTAA